jgi:hypothetical protein
MINTLQTSVGVLQATTAFIGVGVASGVALSATNLYQTLKLRKEIQDLRLDLKDGFLDIKEILYLQQADVIDYLDKIANNIEFKAHRTILSCAYGRFIQSLNIIKNSARQNDISIRNTDLSHARNILHNSLADYNNPLLFSETNPPGVLRRKECSWAIDQTITMTHHLQGACDVVQDRLEDLKNKICQDLLTVVEACKTENELDFIFPELVRIVNQDLMILGLWKDQTKWINELSKEERQEFLEMKMTDANEPNINEENFDSNEIHEQLLYNTIKPKSHFNSTCK